MRKLPILVLALAVSVGLLAGSAQAVTSQVASGHTAHVKPNPKCKSKAYYKKHTALCKANAKAVAKAKAKARAKAKAKAAAAAKAKAGSLNFVGKYAGKASTKVTNGNAAIVANGTGTGNLIGAGKIAGTGTADTTVQPCSPFTGTGTITAAKGAISFAVPTGAAGCGDEGGHVFTLKGTFTVTAATGSLAKAKGSLRFTGVYNRDAGTFSINVSGKLTK